MDNEIKEFVLELLTDVKEKVEADKVETDLAYGEKMVIINGAIALFTEPVEEVVEEAPAEEPAAEEAPAAEE